MVCLFCQKETNDGISIHGSSELATNARTIVTKYFWFDINEINSAEKYACSICWPKVETFHEFYIMVEANYRSNLNDIDSKSAFNPLFDCEPEIIVDESLSVKTEIDTLDPCVPTDYGTIYIPSTSDWDRLNEQKDEANSIFHDEIDNNPTRSSAADERFQSKKKRKLSIHSSESKQKSSTKIKSTTSEPKKQAIPWQLPSDIEKIICFICCKTFSTFPNLRRHFHLHDPPDSYIHDCNLCGKKFSRKVILRDHLKYHEARKKYDKTLDVGYVKVQCTICNKEVTRRSLKSHILVMHENKKPVFKKTLICEVCGTGFSAPSKLAHHAISHIDREHSKMQCDECGKWLKNQIMLRKHKLTHVHTPVECPFCSKIKFNKDALRSHIAQCHTTPKHHCSICNKSYLRRKLLEAHIATHTTSKNI